MLFGSTFSRVRTSYSWWPRSVSVSFPFVDNPPPSFLLKSKGAGHRFLDGFLMGLFAVLVLLGHILIEVLLVIEYHQGSQKFHQFNTPVRLPGDDRPQPTCKMTQMTDCRQQHGAGVIDRSKDTSFAVRQQSETSSRPIEVAREALPTPDKSP